MGVVLKLIWIDVIPCLGRISEQWCCPLLLATLTQARVDIICSFTAQTSIEYVGSVTEGWVTDRGMGTASDLESGHLWAARHV